MVQRAARECQFCNVSAENGFKIIWENESFVAFHDRNPSARQHIQLVPKKHIKNVKHLNKLDVEMVKQMEEIGHQILEDLDVHPSLRKLGFHIPPFYSVDHLHMHVQGLPYKSFSRRLKYPVIKGTHGNNKGFSWFIDVGQLVLVLESGSRVTVLPC